MTKSLKSRAIVLLYANFVNSRKKNGYLLALLVATFLIAVFFRCTAEVAFFTVTEDFLVATFFGAGFLVATTFLAAGFAVSFTPADLAILCN